MNRRRLAVVAFVFATIGGVAACADTDPHYGPPEAIRGRQIDFGMGTSGGTMDTDSGGTPKTARQLFTPLHTSIATTCAPCHQAGGMGVTFFVGASEDESYMIFKAKNYQDLTIPAPKGFFLKGVHTGPALTAPQQQLTRTWATAEAAGGMPPVDSGTPPGDAGGG